MSGFNGQANGFQNFNSRRWNPVPNRVSVAPSTPFSFGETGQGSAAAFGDQRIVALVSVPQTTIITNV